MAQPAYPVPLPVAQTAVRLAEAMAIADHEFWPDDVSLLSAGVVDWRHVVGPRQVTDIYLVANGRPAARSTRHLRCPRLAGDEYLWVI